LLAHVGEMERGFDLVPARVHRLVVGRNAGQFGNAHNITVDSKGNIYTGEAMSGMRAQKFVFKGVKPLPRS